MICVWSVLSKTDFCSTGTLADAEMPYSGVRQRLALLDLPTDEASLLRHCILTDDLSHIDRRRRSENRVGFALLLCALPHVSIRCLYGAGSDRYLSSQRREAVASEVTYGIFDADGGSSFGILALR